MSPSLSLLPASFLSSILRPVLISLRENQSRPHSHSFMSYAYSNAVRPTRYGFESRSPPNLSSARLFLTPVSTLVFCLHALLPRCSLSSRTYPHLNTHPFHPTCSLASRTVGSSASWSLVSMWGRHTAVSPTSFWTQERYLVSRM